MEMKPASLDALRDIRLPPADPLWIAPHWWLTLLVLTLFAMFGVIWWVRRLLLTRTQRRALRELAILAAAHARDGDSIQLARALSQLLRKYTIRRFPDSDVAGLTGHAWLDFLDAHGGGGAFRRGAGAVLATHPYQAHTTPMGDVDAPALIAAVHGWLKANPQ
jgi:hypothetical protein